MRTLALLFLVGCAGTNGEEIAASEDELAGSKAPNVGFEGTWNKVGAFVDCDDTPLFYYPGKDNAALRVIGAEYPKGTTLKRNRPVLVQRAPGEIEVNIDGKKVGFVWTDPDIWGMRGDGDQDARDDRFGKGKVTKSTIANMPQVERRGWVRTSCLRPALKSNALPQAMFLHPYGDAEPIKTGKTVIKHIKKTCVIPENVRYKNSDGTPVSYHSYGQLHGGPIYMLFNTPSARTKDGELGGGGMTAMYSIPGWEFRVKATIIDDNLIGNGHDNGKWAYGYLAGFEVWGWIYWDCLE